MNLNFVFSNSMNLNLIFLKSLNLNFVFLSSMNSTFLRSMNLNFVFSTSMNLKLIFSKSIYLNFKVSLETAEEKGHRSFGPIAHNLGKSAFEFFFRSCYEIFDTTAADLQSRFHASKPGLKTYCGLLNILFGTVDEVVKLYPELNFDELKWNWYFLPKGGNLVT